jgi:hypothetical protein
MRPIFNELKLEKNFFDGFGINPSNVIQFYNYLDTNEIKENNIPEHIRLSLEYYRTNRNVTEDIMINETKKYWLTNLFWEQVTRDEKNENLILDITRQVLNLSIENYDIFITLAPIYKEMFKIRARDILKNQNYSHTDAYKTSLIFMNLF